jgi:hypothetical protein
LGLELFSERTLSNRPTPVIQLVKPLASGG